MAKKDNLAFLAGICSLLIWALGSTFTRTLSEEMGTLTSGALANLLGGALAVFYKAKTTGFKNIRKAPFGYWAVCGTSFIVFTVSILLAIGLAQTREQVVTSGLIRLMWPLMALILTIPIWGKKVSPWFICSVSVSLAGILIANLSDGFSAAALMRSFADAWLPSVFALVSSLAWGIYSNFIGKYSKGADGDYVGILMIVAGIIQGVLSLFFDEPRSFALRQAGELLYMVLMSSFISNLFWNMAMQSKRSMSVILVANFSPVITTVIVGLTLGVPLTFYVIAGAVLVAVGTIWSKNCFRESDAAQD